MIISEAMTAEIEGPFVVFLVGMRINKPFKVWSWIPMARSMGKMVTALYASPPDSGFMGHSELGMLTMVQYWRSVEHLEAYANAPLQQHSLAWSALNARVPDKERGAVGIWYETYLVEDGAYDVLYRGVPAHGLGKCGGLVPVTSLQPSTRGKPVAAQ